MAINLDRVLLDLQAGNYEQAGTNSTYAIDDGKVVFPVQGPEGTPPVVLSIHAPYTKRRTTGNVVKRGSPGLIPPPADTRTGHIFTSGTITVPSPSLSGTNQQVFATSFVYDYVLPAHLKDTGKILFDALPYYSAVDLLGNIPEDANQQLLTDPDNLGMGGMWTPWRGAYYNLGDFTSQRLLG